MKKGKNVVFVRPGRAEQTVVTKDPKNKYGYSAPCKTTIPVGHYESEK